MLNGIIHDDSFNILNDIIYHKDRIFLVLKSSLKKKILEVSHDVRIARHLGFAKTYRKVREILPWEGQNKYVMEYVRECASCQQNKLEPQHTVGLLQPIPIPK